MQHPMTGTACGMPLSLSPALTAAAEDESGTAPIAVTPQVACARPFGTPRPGMRHPPHPRRSLSDCTGHRKGARRPYGMGLRPTLPLTGAVGGELVMGNREGSSPTPCRCTVAP
jgi:hypothetical protein